MAKTKFFRIAVEGQTATDGRTITAQMLNECAETFNPDTYGVRINMEHIRGFSAEPPFNAYGDVLALKTEQVTIKIDNKDEQRTALFAQLDPTDPLIKINRDRQKVYTSIEPQPNFAGTGKYGLVGLAVTDSPASLGTEMLKFSTRTDDPAAVEMKANLDRRKTSQDSLFSAALETRFELETEATSTAAHPSALDKLAELFAAALGKKQEPSAPAAAVVPVAPQPNDFAATMGAFVAAVSADRQADNAAADRRFNDIGRQLGEVKTLLEKTPDPNHLSRQPVVGGGAHQLADC